MKKILFFGAMVALLLGTAACSSDMEPSMGDNMVRFTIEMPGNIDSRAISDGLTANKLTVAVYDEQGNELPDIRVNKDIPHQTTVEFKLVKGQKYSFAFWAQAEGAPYTFDTETKTVNVSYTDAKSNDEKRDAFYAYRADLTVNGPIEEVVVLTRPFCQLNYGASDYADAIKAGITATQSAVTVNHAATSFNLSNGATDGDVEATFTQEVLPNDPETLVVNETDYQWMAMNYFLVPNNQATIETSLQLYEEDATVPVRDITVPNVPVQKNHRTNIVGNLFTEDVNFLVIIDERFDQPDYIRDLNRPEVADGMLLVNGMQYDDLAAAIAAANGNVVYMGKGTYDTQITVGDGETVKLAAGKGLNRDEVVISQQIKTEAGATLELDGIKVTSNVALGACIEAGGVGTKVVLNAVETSGRRGVNAYNGAEVLITNSYINAPIEDGSYYNRALNIYGQGVKVTVKNSAIVCDTHYAINYPTSANGSELVLNECNVTGWACINMYGSNNTIKAEGCKFTSINVNKREGSNDFAAFTVNDPGINNTFEINHSSVYIESKQDAAQFLLFFFKAGNKFKGSNNLIKGVHTNTSDYDLGPYYITEMNAEDFAEWDEETIVIDWN